MKMTREKACHRLHHRVSTPLNVLIDGREYSASDWSLGGMRINNWDRWDDGLALGDKLPCKFELPFQGFSIAFNVETEIIRMIPESKEMGQKFIDLDERQIELLNHFVEQLVRGSMMSIEDTILRIDSPVTPVSTAPDPSPVSEVPISRLPTKLIAMSTFYGVLGLVVMSLVLLTIYENFLNLKVETAVTSVPVEPIVSLIDGRIKRVNAAVNVPVSSGMTMMVLESPDLKKRIEGAKISIEQKKIELEAHRKRHVLAIETSGSAASKEAKLHQIEIDLVQQEVTLAMQSLVALYDFKENMEITSPGNGRLVNLFRQPGSLVKRGETIGIFERDQAPKIHAFLTDKEARDITLNHPAQVRLLNSGQQWHGRVTDIKTDTALIVGPQIRYQPNNTGERPILVEIELAAPQHGQRMPLSSGLPVEVLFPTTRVSRSINEYFNEPAAQAVSVETIQGSRI